MKLRTFLTSTSFAFLIPIAGALMLLNYSMFDHFLRSIGKEILFTGIRVAIAGSPDPRKLEVSVLKANIAASEFVRPLRSTRTYLHRIRANEVLIQRVGFLRYHFVLASPGDSGKLLVFEIFSEKILWFFHAATGFMWLLLLSFTWAVRRRARKESLIKESLMKDALESWLRHGEISSFVSERFPQLVQWWERRQLELDQQTRALHDIKVPLAALENGGVSNVEHSVRAIQSILNTPTGGQQDHEFEFDEVIRSAVRSAEAVSTRVKVSVRLSPGRSPKIKGSAEEFRRHFTNLLMNAIEASREPMGVSNIVIEALAEEDDRGLTVSVRDWGKGIPARALARIGKKGFTFGKPKGTGFGLHFCKTWIESLGGELLVSSEEGKGSTVSLKFPWSAIALDGEAAFDSIVKDEAPLIVFDDDAIFRDVYAMIFRGLGVRSERLFWAKDEEALDEILMRLGSTKSWIFSDYYFDGVGTKGPDFLTTRKIAHRGILLSNVDEREELRDKLAKVGMVFLSKQKLAERLGTTRRQNDQPEQRVPADHYEQHPAGAV